jgi:hypothetical protein
MKPSAAISLLQAHSWTFWTIYAGDLGPLWAAALESCSLWAWWSRRWLLGSLAVALTLAGPLGAVGIPVWRSLQEEHKLDAARVAVVAQHQAAIQELQRQATVYLSNTQDRKRSGWAQEVERTQARLQAERAALAHAETVTTGGLPTIVGHSVIVLDALALCLFQIVAILCVRALRDTATNSAPVPITVVPRMESSAIPNVVTTDEPNTAVTLPAPELSKREAIRAALQSDPSLSNRRIGLAVGASHTHVARVRGALAIAGN